MAFEGTDHCELLVSPFPTPVPSELQVRVRAQERRVLLVDSRKPNSLSILERVRDLLGEQGIPVESIDKKKHPVGGEDSARIKAWSQFRGLLLFGVFD